MKDENNNPFKDMQITDDGLYVHTSKKESWVEENVLYSEDTSDSKFLTPFFSTRKFIVLFLILISGVIGLFVRAGYLQLYEGQEMAELAQDNRTKQTAMIPNRGIIYDRHGVPLVRNVPDFYLSLTPAYLPKDETELNKFLISLGNIIHKDPNVLKEELDLDDIRTLFSYQPRVLQEHIDYESALLLKIASSQLPGVDIQTSSQRQYLFDELDRTSYSLSHLLGYVGKLSQEEYADLRDDGYFVTDMIGKSGIEKSYESYLKGQNGYRLSEVDAFGKELAVLQVQESIPGDDLYLTIDSSLQGYVEERLQTFLDENDYSRGVVIVMDPNDFSILSMVSLPTFDNNLFSQGISQEDFSSLLNDEDKPLFHRAVVGEYPPGSTFKLAMAASALQEGIIAPLSGVLSTGGIEVGPWFFPDWKAGGHGLVNMYQAIAESVNTFFYYVGGGYQGKVGLGVERINAYASQFGLGSKTGIDLPSESTGLLPTIAWKEENIGERWYVGDTYNLSIGQGYLTATPLQIAAMTSVFANHGSLYKPHLLEKRMSVDGVQTIHETQLVNAQFIDPGYIRVVRDGMRRAVTSGSARRLSDLPFEAAAKTGTAQFSSVKEPHSWLTSFAPFDDPQVVVTVLIEEGGEGSESAVVVAREVLARVLADIEL